MVHICLLSGLLIGSRAWGIELYVPDNYSTIQSAIDNCSSGDVVIISPGIHSGSGNRDLDFSAKAITVRSANPDDSATVAATVIDCQATSSDMHRGFVFSHGEGPSSTVAGLTIKNGCQTYGGAIHCSSASKPTIKQCVFRANAASIDGGAIYCMGASAPTIVNCTFSGNSARYGGAMYCNYSSPAVTGCLFQGNTASTSGGAISCWGSNPTIFGGLFVGNTATNSGGGVYCYSSSGPAVTNCTFSRNVGTTYGGGGIFCNAVSSPAIRNSILWENTPGEVRVVSGTPSIKYCDVKGGWTGEGNINADPLFADPDTGDFHLKSASGRWDPSANGGTGGWVYDNVTSPCIGAADNSTVEMGSWGTTPYASIPPQRVLLTTIVVGGHGAISPDNGSYNLGSIVTVTATPESGYRVRQWTGTDTVPAAGLTTNTVTMSDNKTVGVEFEVIPATPIAGDIDASSLVDQTDLALCAKMAVWLDVDISGQTFSYPYASVLAALADLTGEGQVDISDVMKIKRIIENAN